MKCKGYYQIILEQPLQQYYKRQNGLVLFEKKEPVKIPIVFPIEQVQQEPKIECCMSGCVHCVLDMEI